VSFRVVSVTGPASLRLKDKGLHICREGEAVHKIPVEDMAVLVLDGPDLLLSHALISFCMDHGVSVITSDPKHVPNGVLLPLAGNSTHTEILRAQIDAGVPAQKRAWQAIIRAKICAQADAVAFTGGNDAPLRQLIPFVRSGDPDNVEGTAAARYFSLMFGEGFLRDREEPGINARLNYGYAIIRSAVARAIVGAGLHPALGVYHHNRYNAFCLADDAMEPLRPMVDLAVWRMCGEVSELGEIDPPTKRRLISVMGQFVRIDGLRFPLLVGLERYGASLRRAICEGAALSVPLPDVSGG